MILKLIILSFLTYIECFMMTNLKIINGKLKTIEKEINIEETIIKKLTFTLTHKYRGYIIPDKDMGNKKFDVTPKWNSKTNETEYLKLNGKRFEPVSIQPLLEKKDFHVVMLGDFNDHNITFLYRGFRPFKTTINKFLKGNSVYDNLNTNLSCGRPPVSCCIEETQYTPEGGFEKWKPKKTMGDYIMVNDKLTITKENEVPIEYKGSLKDNEKPYPPNEMASDHLPVFMQVSFEGKTAKSKSADKHKHTETIHFTCLEEKYEIKRTKKKKGFRK